MYRSTNDQFYLDKAKEFYWDFGLNEVEGVPSWDDKAMATNALMAQMLSGDEGSDYRDGLERFCDTALYSQERSPKGQLFYLKWGSLRYSANAAVTCLMASELIPEMRNEYVDLAKGQMDYILGKHGQSFVVGYGPNHPRNPHHASSSCPDAPATCDWNTFNGPQDNAHLLVGALVGGPDSPDDQYRDVRNDYVENEVTTDYNAGYQFLLAGLQETLCMNS